MQPQPSTCEPAVDSASFAGLLAALTASRAPSLREERDDLDDDIVSLSYERALQAHARHKPSGDLQPSSRPGTPNVKIACADKEPSSCTAVTSALNSAACKPRSSASDVEKTRKSASVTIRMSAAEFAQLQQRAAEAGLTVSAYLRSCTFEAEALRTQVKQALAGLRHTQPPQPSRSRWLHLFRREQSQQKASSP